VSLNVEYVDDALPYRISGVRFLYWDGLSKSSRAAVNALCSISDRDVGDFYDGPPGFWRESLGATSNLRVREREPKNAPSPPCCLLCPYKQHTTVAACMKSKQCNIR
jgi:hypothetical protein